MTETQHRFLKEIAARVPAGHVAEVRLFPSLRQGRVESGVAVLAVEATTSPDAGPGDATPAGDVAPPDALAAEVPATELLAEEGPIGNVPATEAPPSEVPLAVPVASEAIAAAGASSNRFSILTAHYRLTLKGPDRGKWEFSMVHDADAPLEALEQVVRGVARRVGDSGEPDLLLTAGEFQRALAEPWWSATT